MKIGSPPEGACSDTESDIRALRRQFGVPSEGSCVTLVYRLWWHQAKPTSVRQRPTPLFSWLRGSPARRAMGHFSETELPRRGPIASLRFICTVPFR
jgi:hypothetical protein